MNDATNLLIAYDGSDQSKEAITVAAKLFGPGARATLLYAWEPVAMYPAVPLGAPAPPMEDIERDEQEAIRLVRDGVRHARELGLEAEGWTEQTTTSTWRTIVGAAERAGADLVVMGSRGLLGVRSMLLGSVSRLVAQHAPCPVLIVPDAQP
jgi:nucleotide-binding universal stress UspA family protein